MSSKFLYVTGAGASANVLPVINQFEIYLDYFIKNFKHDTRIHNFSMIDFNIKEIVSQFKSPDKYARWLYISGGDPNKVENIKRMYNFILGQITSGESSVGLNRKNIPTAEQIKRIFPRDYNKSISYIKFGKQYIDYRYILFFSSILSSTNIDRNLNFLETNFIFMTWNYDLSIKIALDSFFKVNNKDYSNIITYINGHISANNDDDHQIDFFWEKQNNLKDQIDKKMIDIKELVYIGYSFPLYNWEMDKVLLKNAFVSNAKVIIQNINAEDIKKKIIASGIIEEFASSEIGRISMKTKSVEDFKDSIVPFTVVDNFYIPNEIGSYKGN